MCVHNREGYLTAHNREWYINVHNREWHIKSIRWFSWKVGVLGGRLNKKVPSYQYRDPHYKD